MGETLRLIRTLEVGDSRNVVLYVPRMSSRLTIDLHF